MRRNELGYKRRRGKKKKKRSRQSESAHAAHRHNDAPVRRRYRCPNYRSASVFFFQFIFQSPDFTSFIFHWPICRLQQTPLRRRRLYFGRSFQDRRGGDEPRILFSHFPKCLSRKIGLVLLAGLFLLFEVLFFWFQRIFKFTPDTLRCLNGGGGQSAADSNPTAPIN